MNSITFTFTRKSCKIVQVMIYDKNENIFLNILHDMRLEPTISILTAIRSIQGLSETVLDMGLENTSLCNQYFS